MQPPALKNQAVRDLAWMLFSPPLVSLPNDSGIRVLWPARDLDTAELKTWLHDLDAEPEELLAHLDAAKSPRLGIYFEALCGFFFSRFKGFTLIAQNLQVNRTLNDTARQTLGEFDFIVRYGQETLHIETAVKFYLGTGSLAQHTGAEFWIGPNANDRLDKKIDRLLTHQLALADWPEGKARLDDFSAGEVTKCLLMSGYLFYPHKDQCPSPESVHDEHGRGKWLHFSDAKKFIASNENETSAWCQLKKRRWLTPARSDINPAGISPADTDDGGKENTANEVMDADAMIGHLEEYFSVTRALDEASIQALKKSRLKHNPRLTHRPILISQLDKEQTGLQSDDEWYESERYFVVPDYWPASATPPRRI